MDCGAATQPEISTNGAAFTNTTNPSVLIESPSLYYVDLTSQEVGNGNSILVIRVGGYTGWVAVVGYSGLEKRFRISQGMVVDSNTAENEATKEMVRKIIVNNILPRLK